MKTKGPTIYYFLLGTFLALSMHYRTLLYQGVSELCLILLLVFGLICIRKVKHLSSNEFFILLCFLLLCSSLCISVLLSEPKQTILALGYFFRIVYGFSIFFMLKLILNERQETIFVLKVYMYYASIIAALTFTALLLFYLGDATLDTFLYIRNGLARGAGLFGEPNYYSIGMLFYFFVAFYLWREKESSFYMVAVSMLGVFSSLSRSGSIVVIIFLVLYGCLNFRWMSVRRGFLVSLILIPLCVLFAAYENNLLITMSDAILYRLTDGGGGANDRMNTVTSSLSSLDTMAQVLFGHGRAYYENINARGISPHNSLITITVDYGVIGISFFLLLLIIICGQSFHMSIQYSVPIVAGLIVLFLTNDYYLTKEWWLILLLIVIIRPLNQAMECYSDNDNIGCNKDCAR